MSDNARIPLPTLLSHVLTAFAIEFDNEFEYRVLAPTGLTYAQWRARPGFYLISLGGWATYLRHLEHGLSVADVAGLARLSASGVRSELFNLSRWGFVDVFPKVDLRRRIPKPDSRVELSPTGRDCWELLAPLTEIVEARWRSRFGKGAFAKLCAGLSELVVQVDPRLPDFLPVVSSRHKRQPFCAELDPPIGSFAADPELAVGALPLYALVARVLQAFTWDFEQRSAVSLTALADFVRPLADGAVAVSDLPQLAGVSEAAIMQGRAFLTKAALAVLEPVADAKGKQLQLTEAGQQAWANGQSNLRQAEAHWDDRFGAARMRSLRDALEAFVVSRDLASSPLGQGLNAVDGCWRASVPPPAALPEHPMIIGRGWWPDGA